MQPSPNPPVTQHSEQCISMFDFSYEQGILVARETRGCKRAASRILCANGILMALCDKHADFEWFFRASLAEKETPNA